MKARINRPSADRILFCLGYPQDKLARLRQVAESAKFTVRVLTDSDLSEKVGDILAGRQTGNADEYEPVNTGVEALLFSPMRQKELFDIIDVLSANDVNTPYKAVIGPINSAVQLDRLLTDIMREHEQMHRLSQKEK